MILSPESLLNNLLEGIEEASVEDEQSEDEILKDSEEKMKNCKDQGANLQHLSENQRQLKLTTKGYRATVLLHKRPYNFRRYENSFTNNHHYQNEQSVLSNETAYFKNQMDRREKLNFDLD